MSTYAIGDVQGCFDSLQALLRRVAFDSSRDRLWLAGDLVNRGPRSLDALRWIRDLGERAVCVLGNHDLHLLAVAAGVRNAKEGDTIAPILAAPDAEALLDWVRRRPLLYREGRFAMVHAGLHPAWTVDDAQAEARDLEARLRGPDWRRTLLEIFDGPPPAWSRNVIGAGRRAAVAGILTTMRGCTADGRPARKLNGPPSELPPGVYPWFDVPGRRSTDATVVCGHWAALGFVQRPDLIALDTGCVWGNALTAVRLEDGAAFHQPALEPPAHD